MATTRGVRQSSRARPRCARRAVRRHGDHSAAERSGWFVAFAATWKIGAVPQPVSHRLPLSELERITELAGSKAVIGGPREAIAEYEHALMSERGRV